MKESEARGICPSRHKTDKCLEGIKDSGQKCSRGLPGYVSNIDTYTHQEVDLHLAHLPLEILASCHLLSPFLLLILCLTSSSSLTLSTSHITSDIFSPPDLLPLISCTSQFQLSPKQTLTFATSDIFYVLPGQCLIFSPS